MNIKEIVKDKKTHFQFYKSGELWYKTESDVEYPVPIDDIGDGIFLAEDKAILHMRYIRKHLEMIKTAKEIQ